jgi:hypothetical protein
MTTRCYEPINKCRKKLLDQDWHYFTGIAGTLHSLGGWKVSRRQKNIIMTTRCYEPINKCRKKLLDQDWHYFTGIASTLHSRNSHAGKFIYLNARYETENRWRQLVGCNCRNPVTPFTQEKKDCMPSGETEGDTQQNEAREEGHTQSPQDYWQMHTHLHHRSMQVFC